MLRPAIFRNNLFDDFFDDMFLPSDIMASNVRGNVMNTDIRELADSYQIEMELPGFSKQDVKADLKDGYMTIEASKSASNDTKDEDGKYVRRERYQGNYRRSFYVGDNVTEKDIKAKFTDGILTISIPKREAAQEVEQKKYIAIEG